MERLGSNYQPQIHDHDYAAAYLSTPLDSRGLIDADRVTTKMAFRVLQDFYAPRPLILLIPSIPG